ncbi:MAG: ACP S-malonyltransferase [Candidatus Babeliales bacterium]
MKIGVLFPGYGSQFVGMAKELYDESRIMQEYFEEAASCLDKNFVKLCFASSDSELARIENAYPALFLVTSGIAAVLKDQGITIDAVAGYNLGEYGAIHAASGLSLPDGLYLLAKYASFYETLLSTVSVAGLRLDGVDLLQAQELCAQASNQDARVYVGAHETANTQLVFGDEDAIERVRTLVQEFPDIHVDTAAIEMGLHSMLMDPVVANLKMYLEKVDFRDLSIPLYTNADAKLVTQGSELKTAVIKQVHVPVLWAEICAQYAAYDLIIIGGPGGKLPQMISALYPEKTCITVTKQADIDTIKALIAEKTDKTEIVEI